jgi:tRNA-specific 2-thiouridylase
MTLQHTKVVVAMSGGVDSSVSAALLVERGYEVIGIMMRLWSEPGGEESNRCCTPDAMAMARRVAAHLNIPFYALDAKEIFRQVVVDYFLTGYTQNITPNPCLACNRHIRWEYLLNYALTLGADAWRTLRPYLKLDWRNRIAAWAGSNRINPTSAYSKPRKARSCPLRLVNLLNRRYVS